MASLKKGGDVNYIRFFAIIDGERKRGSFSLSITLKREAEKMLIKYEDLLGRGEINPFNGWTTKQEMESKRKSLKGKYMSLKYTSDLFIKNRS